MRRLTIAFTLGTISCWLGGCAGTRHAEQYAKQLSGVASTYQNEVARKVKAEQDSYQNLAAIYEGAEIKNSINVLRQERLERASELTDDIMARAARGTPPTDSELRKLLRDYGNFDYTVTADILSREMDAANRRLAGLETLNAQIQQLQTVESVLGDLSQPKSKLGRLKDAGGFVQSTKDCLDEKFCTELKTQLDSLQAQLKSATTDTNKAVLNQKIKEVKAAQEAHNCAASPSCTIKTK